MLQNKQENTIKLSKWSYHETLACKYIKAKISKENQQSTNVIGIIPGIFFLASLIKTIVKEGQVT